MIGKIKIMAFIFLFLFLISNVSADELENGTEDVSIETHDVEMYYNDGTRFEAVVHDGEDNPITNNSISFNLNNMDYSRTTNDDGRASIGINLNSGNYTVKTSFKNMTKNNTIIIKSTIEGSDITKIYKNSTQYSAKFIGTTGETLKNTRVTFNINGIFYTRTCNDSGIAKLNINLPPGLYILTAYNPNTTESVSNIITVLSKIRDNNDIVMYYRNSSKYTVTLVSDNGEKVGSREVVSFNINGVIYKRQTNIYGQASLNVNLPPGEYVITADYNDCKVSNTIKVLSVLEASDIEMGYRDGTKFNVHVVDGSGNSAWNKNVTFNINGVIYTRTTNINGIASLNINLPKGDYIITTTYNGLSISNRIIVKDKAVINENVKENNFTYEIIIPNYQNVTIPYAYDYQYYTLKSGVDGIVRLNKNQYLSVAVNGKYYSFTEGYIQNYATCLSTYKYYLIPFDNGTVQNSYKMENLTGNGIMLYTDYDYLHIYYRNNCSSNIEQFGVYIDQNMENSECIHFIQNGTEKAKISIMIDGYDEFGLQYSLSKRYGCSYYDFNYKTYDEITRGNSDKIRFTNTNESVTFNYFGRSIVGYLSEENVITKFSSPNCIEFEKSEMITYGLSSKYKGDFDILQSFAIINDKITQNQLNKWINREIEYKNNVGMQSIYAMFMTAMNTGFLSDCLADNLTEDYNVEWSRANNTVILGGMNWDYTYQHVLTPDMGRSIKGLNESNVINFRFANSLMLSKIEQITLQPIADDGNMNVSSAFDDIITSLAVNNASVVYYNDTEFITDESGSNSTLVIDLKTGLVTALTTIDGFAFKGATVSRDCGLCSIFSILKNIMQEINNGLTVAKNTIDYINSHNHPLSTLSIKGLLISKGAIGAIFKGSSAVGLGVVGLGVVGTALALQSVGVYYVNNFVDDKDIHSTYDHLVFTRPGYFEDVKIYNIPQKDGSVDYIQVKINKDSSLNRENVLYISNGNTRTLSKEETYQYFTEETWDPFNVPRKYWR